MNYITAHTPKWKTRTSIELIVLFEGNFQEIPFVAHKDDTDESNRELFDYAENLVAEIQSSEFPENIDIENGWPEVYK